MFLCLNTLPLRSGITGGLSPRELVTGLTVNFTKHCTVDVGVSVEASIDAIITNSNNDRTHTCIALGPSGNRQGSLNCLDLDTSQVVVLGIFKQIIGQGRLIRKANVWGKKVKNAILKGQIKFLNRREGKFDWDSDFFSEIEMADKVPKLVQPNFTAEISGIKVNSNYEPIIGPKPSKEPEVNSSYEEIANKAQKRWSKDVCCDTVQHHRSG